MEPSEATRASARVEAHNYTRRATLYSVSGKWPLTWSERRQIEAKTDRYKLPRWWGHLDRPPQTVPEAITDEQVAMVNALIEPRGWTLVRNTQGWWGVVRVL